MENKLVINILYEKDSFYDDSGLTYPDDLKKRMMDSVNKENIDLIDGDYIQILMSNEGKYTLKVLRQQVPSGGEGV